MAVAADVATAAHPCHAADVDLLLPDPCPVAAAVADSHANPVAEAEAAVASLG